MGTGMARHSMAGWLLMLVPDYCRNLPQSNGNILGIKNSTNKTAMNQSLDVKPEMSTKIGKESREYQHRNVTLRQTKNSHGQTLQIAAISTWETPNNESPSQSPNLNL